MSVHQHPVRPRKARKHTPADERRRLRRQTALRTRAAYAKMAGKPYRPALKKFTDVHAIIMAALLKANVPQRRRPRCFALLIAVWKQHNAVKGALFFVGNHTLAKDQDCHASTISRAKDDVEPTQLLLMQRNEGGTTQNPFCQLVGNATGYELGEALLEPAKTEQPSEPIYAPSAARTGGMERVGDRVAAMYADMVEPRAGPP